MVNAEHIKVIAQRVTAAPKYTKVHQLIEGFIWEEQPEAKARSVDKWTEAVFKEVLKQQTPAKVEVLENMMQKDVSTGLFKKLMKHDASLPKGVREVLEEISMCVDDLQD
jgi:hypothetical protein